MLPIEKTIAASVAPGQHYSIPEFQRTYTWSKKEWQRLWDDTIRFVSVRDKATPKTPTSYFLGFLVVNQNFEPDSSMGDILNYEVIDGQQRLITTSLFLIAMRDVLRAASRQLILDGNEIEDAIEVIHQYIYNSKAVVSKLVHTPVYEDALYRIKLLGDDDKIYRLLVEGDIEGKDIDFSAIGYGTKTVLSHPAVEIDYDVTAESSDDEFDDGGMVNVSERANLIAGRDFFYNSINAYIKSSGLSPLASVDALRSSLINMGVVFTELFPHDNAQQIFESINNSGKRLAPGDIIKNALMLRCGAQGKKRGGLYNNYWKLFDTAVWQQRWKVKGYRDTLSLLDKFLFFYLTSIQTASTIERPSIDTLTNDFIDYIEKRVVVAKLDDEDNDAYAKRLFVSFESFMEKMYSSAEHFMDIHEANIDSRLKKPNPGSDIDLAGNSYENKSALKESFGSKKDSAEEAIDSILSIDSSSAWQVLLWINLHRSKIIAANYNKVSELYDLYSVIEKWLVLRSVAYSGINGSNTSLGLYKVMGQLNSITYKSNNLIDTSNLTDQIKEHGLRGIAQQLHRWMENETTKYTCLPSKNELLDRALFVDTKIPGDVIKVVLAILENDSEGARLGLSSQNGFYSALDHNDDPIKRQTSKGGKLIHRGLTHEHVIPQMWEEHWKSPAAPYTDEDRERAVYKLGNMLLITSRDNSAIKNKVWSIKRQTFADDKASVFTQELSKNEEWEESKVDERSKHLIEHLIKIYGSN